MGQSEATKGFMAYRRKAQAVSRGPSSRKYVMIRRGGQNRWIPNNGSKQELVAIWQQYKTEHHIV